MFGGNDYQFGNTDGVTFRGGGFDPNQPFMDDLASHRPPVIEESKTDISINNIDDLAMYLKSRLDSIDDKIDERMDAIEEKIDSSEKNVIKNIYDARDDVRRYIG